MRIQPLALIPCLAGCGIGVVRVEGTVGDGTGVQAPGLADAGVEIRDADGFSFDTASTDDDGDFTAEAPPGETIYAWITHPEGIVSSFTGASGLQPTLQVEPGALYGVSSALDAEWLGKFAGCPGLAEEGGVVLGQVHVYLPGNEPDDSTRVTTATAELIDPATGDPLDHVACYLDPTTGLYSAAQTLTGDLGWYAIGGVDEGAYVLLIEFEFADDLFDRAYTDIWMPPNGRVPGFPTFVEFPVF